MALPAYVVPGQIICPVVEKVQEGVWREFAAGRGARLQKSADGVSAIYSNQLGKVHIVSLQGKKEDDEMEVDEDNSEGKKKVALKFQVNVENESKNPYKGTPHGDRPAGSSGSGLPEVGDLVLAKVIRISLTNANVEILAIENHGNVTADSGLGVNAPGAPVSNASGSAATGGSGAGGVEIGDGFGGVIRVQDVRATERDKVKMQECFKPGDIIRAQVISLGDGSNYYLSTAKNELGVLFAKSRSGGQMIPVDWQTMQCSLTGQTESRKCAKPY